MLLVYHHGGPASMMTDSPPGCVVCTCCSICATVYAGPTLPTTDPTSPDLAVEFAGSGTGSVRISTPPGNGVGSGSGSTAAFSPSSDNAGDFRSYPPPPGPL